MSNKSKGKRDVAVYVSANPTEKDTIYDLLDQINAETGLERPRILINALSHYWDSHCAAQRGATDTWEGESF